MKIGSRKIHIFSRRPLSAPGKTTVATLLGLTTMCGLMSLLAPALLPIAVFMFLTTILIALGVRWAPSLATILSAVILYIFLIKEPFPIYHLTHPKDALDQPSISFILFVVILIIIWCSLVAFIAGTSAVIQNYSRYGSQTPVWFKPAITGLIGAFIGAILIAAIAQPGTATATTSTNGEPTVHLGISSFNQSSIAVSKGSKLLLIDDGSFAHNLVNGTWANGQPQTMQEPGAPIVSNLTVNGKNVEIGPFNTAGTYHIYCTIHSGMTLTILVQ